MFGWTGRDWGNLFGLRGVPGAMEMNQNLMGNLMPGQASNNIYYDGSAGNMSQLLSAMRGQGGGTSQPQSQYLGGDGLI